MLCLLAVWVAHTQHAADMTFLSCLHPAVNLVGLVLVNLLPVLIIQPGHSVNVALGIVEVVPRLRIILSTAPIIYDAKKCSTLELP
jgi:hypothetical protein